MFLGGDNYTLLLMQKEPLSRSTQDSDTAACEKEVCPHFSGVSWLLEERGKSGSLSSFTFSQCPSGKKGGGAAAKRRRVVTSEFGRETC